MIDNNGLQPCKVPTRAACIWFTVQKRALLSALLPFSYNSHSYSMTLSFWPVSICPPFRCAMPRRLDFPSLGCTCGYFVSPVWPCPKRTTHKLSGKLGWSFGGRSSVRTLAAAFEWLHGASVPGQAEPLKACCHPSLHTCKSLCNRYFRFSQ